MKNVRLINILLTLTVILSIIGGTFAWLNYRSNDTALVLTVGDINGLLVSLKPYKVDGTMTLTNNYEINSKVIDVKVDNNASTSESFNLYFDIKQIDEELKNSNYFKYKITKSTDGNTYTEVPGAVGNFTAANNQTIFYIYGDEIANNTTSYYKVYIYLEEDTNADQTNLTNKTFSAELRGFLTLYNNITSQNIKTNPTIGNAATTDADSGVYKTTQDGIDVYYYRGVVKDNNVLYGGYCWKIIRTTKTGGIKMIYNGLPDGNNCGTDTTTSQLDTASLALLDGTNTTYKMQDGGAGSPDYRETTLRTLVDTWFANIDDTLLETTDFCIDAQLDTSITDGYQYTAWSRYVGGVPTLECTGTDRTVFNSKVGLISADELLFAGAPISSSSNNKLFYLYNNKSYWTISPHHYDSSYWNINYVVVDIYGKGGNDWYASTSTGVRPVISLASDVSFTGSGAYNDPYIPN